MDCDDCATGWVATGFTLVVTVSGCATGRADGVAAGATTAAVLEGKVATCAGDLSLVADTSVRVDTTTGAVGTTLGASGLGVATASEVCAGSLSGAGSESVSSVPGGLAECVAAVELPAVAEPVVDVVVPELGDDELDAVELWVCAAAGRDAPEGDEPASDPPSEEEEVPSGAASATAGEQSAASATPIASVTAEAPVVPRAGARCRSLADFAAFAVRAFALARFVNR